MKIRLNTGYAIAFLSMIFLLHELHDQAHFIAGRIFCGCWGTKYFDSWTFCAQCAPTSLDQVVTWLAGPMVNYIVILFAWQLMRAGNSVEKKSLGFSLLFAAQPLIRIWAAARGGSDETGAFRLLLQMPAGKDRHIPALLGLALILLFCAPAMLRAFRLMRTTPEKFILYPVFLVLPIFLDQWVLIGWLNSIHFTGFAAIEILPGTPLLLSVWTLLLVVGIIVNRKRLQEFLLPPR